MSVAPLPAYLDESQWISPVDQLNRLLKAEEEKEGQGPMPCRTGWLVPLNLLYPEIEKIPPLPLNFNEIFNRECPIYGPGKKIGDTHVFYLVPKELGNLKKFASRIREYRARTGDGLALWNEVGSGLLESPCESRWVGMTKCALPDSCDLSYKNQKKMIENLREKSSLNYDVPSLIETVAILFFHKLATKENIYASTTELAPNGRVVRSPSVHISVREEGEVQSFFFSKEVLRVHVAVCSYSSFLFAVSNFCTSLQKSSMVGMGAMIKF